MLENLRGLRQEKGISQRQLADVLLVSQQAINKYENHHVEPDIGTLIKMADFFNVSVDYLIGHSDIRHKLERVHSYDLNEDESYIVNEYRKLDPSKKAAIRVLIDSYHS